MGDIRDYFRASTANDIDMEEADVLSCPFCDFKHPEFRLLQGHVRSSHSDQIEAPKDYKRDRPDLSDAELAQLLAFEEAGIPAELALEEINKDKIEDEATENSSEDDVWIDCFCGERILLQEIDTHSNMHQLEIQDPEDVEDGHTVEAIAPGGAVSPSTHTIVERTVTSQKRAHPYQAHGTRLGKSDIGPYAYEERMPKWLHSMLSGNIGVRVEEVFIGERSFRYSALQNETPLLVPKLQLLSRSDHSVLRSVFCSPVINHVSKLLKEGGFCGYRNTQMMISYLRGCHDDDIARTFKGRLPTIFELQDDIEAAWDSGIQAHARSETGGIKNTRKYIGTTEAMALFVSKKIPCRTEAFVTTRDLAACDAMFASVESYFTRTRGSHPPAPVYLQYKGHSLTVVGFEELAPSGSIGLNSEATLIIFDPMYRVPSSLKKLSVKMRKPETKLRFLKAFRYPRQRFKRFDQFELLFLES